MRIVLDTSAMFSPAVTIALGDDPRPKIVPAVAFAERARQLWRDRKVPAQTVLRTFESYGWQVEPFGPVQAARVAARLADDRMWARHARDAMIAGHVEDLDELWTANPRDFLAVGLDGRHLVDVRAEAPRIAPSDFER